MGRYEMFDRDLFVLAVDRPDEIPATLPLPCPYFACLLVWDTAGRSIDELLTVSRRLLTAGCVYVCCWGPGCDAVETACDLADLEVRPDGPYAISTSHAGEPLSEATWFLLHCASPDDAYFIGCRAAVGVSIGSSAWATELRAAFSDPCRFNARVLATEVRHAEPFAASDNVS